MKLPLCGLLLAVVSYLPVQAQSAKWELVPQVGVSHYMGDLVVTAWPRPQAAKPAYGLGLRRNLGEAWSLRLAGQHTQLYGKDAYFADNAGREQRGFSFESTVTELALMAEFDLFGKRRYDKGYLKPTFSPYIMAGLGATIFDAKPHFNAQNNDAMLGKIRQDEVFDFGKPVLMIPFGAGIRYDLSRKVTIGLESGLRLPMTDYLDGISQSGNPDQRDWYMTTSLTLAFRFGKYKDTDGDRVFDRYDRCNETPGETALAGCPDADGDGLADGDDRCPFQRGSSVLKGCPDRDADGVPDRDDECPDLAGRRDLAGCTDGDNDGVADIKDLCPNQMGVGSAMGCPDADLDSIPDSADRCPKEAGVKDNQGCPDRDTDSDGFVDRLDQCPDLAGVKSAMGCPDTDLDSIPNALDKCPTEVGLKVNQGCPDRDTDSDGLVDRLDQCPEKAGLRVLEGCPDSDGDGVIDSRDLCPTVAGATAMQGCPEIPKAEAEAFNLAVKGIQFDLAKATLKKESYTNLDKAAEILKKYPSYSLQIKGHTDSDGDDKKNLELSQNRAKACADYLANKGVAATRMTSEGFGETQPLVPNNSKANKAINRRVDFELVGVK
jgi:OmpA-OmpF porin, OOP family